MSGRLLPVVLAAGTIMCGCAKPVAPTASKPAQTTGRKWIDLQPEWRVRVVTPILRRPGGQTVEATPVADREVDLSTGRNQVVTLSAGEDLLGYESSIYRVTGRRRGGIRVQFLSAELHEKEKITPSERSMHRLFDLPSQAKHVRILHLVRVSRSDHNAAILAAKNPELLDALIDQVQVDRSTCRTERGMYCSWVPQGVAVIPEAMSGSDWKAQ